MISADILRLNHPSTTNNYSKITMQAGSVLPQRSKFHPADEVELLYSGKAMPSNISINKDRFRQTLDRTLGTSLEWMLTVP
jgi:hypothetical protein